MRQLLLGPILSCRWWQRVLERSEFDRIDRIGHHSILHSLGRLAAIVSMKSVQRSEGLRLLGPGIERRVEEKSIRFRLVLYPFPMNT
jgi:hypothetical protein